MWPPLFVCLALRTEAQVEHKPSGRFFMSSAERSIHHQVKPPTKQASLPIKFTSYAFSTEGIINNCQKYFFFPKIFLSPNMIAATMFHFFDVQETKKSIQPLSKHHKKKKKSIHNGEWILSCLNGMTHSRTLMDEQHDLGPAWTHS